MLLPQKSEEEEPVPLIISRGKEDVSTFFKVQDHLSPTNTYSQDQKRKTDFVLVYEEDKRDAVRCQLPTVKWSSFWLYAHLMADNLYTNLHEKPNWMFFFRSSREPKLVTWLPLKTSSKLIPNKLWYSCVVQKVQCNDLDVNHRVLLMGVCLHLRFMPSNLVPLTVKYLWLHASVSLMYFPFLVLWHSLYVLSIAFMHTPGCRIVRLGKYGLGRHTVFSKSQIIEEKTQ